MKKKKKLVKYQFGDKNTLQNKIFVPGDTFATNAQEQDQLNARGQGMLMDEKGNPYDINDLEEVGQTPYEKARGFFSNIEKKIGTQGTELNPIYKTARDAAQAVTGIAELINNSKANQQEQKDYRDALMPTAWENMERYSLNTNPIFTKFGGKTKSKYSYQTGGATDPQYEELKKKYNLRATTPEQRRDWNQFSAFAKSKGYTKGSTQLDTGTGGDELFESYLKANPKSTLTRDIVPSVQYEMLQLRNSVQGVAERKGDPNAKNIMNWASGVDNKIGDQTVYSTYPDAEYREYTDGQLTNQQYLGLTDTNLTAEKKVIKGEGFGQQGQQKFTTLTGAPLPAGAKIERGADGSYYYTNRDGDLVLAKTMQYGGSSMKTKKSVPKGSADVEAEKGEVVEGEMGDISVVDPNGKTHEEGGEFIPDVHRVLENTSDLRNDKSSRYLQLMPEQVKALTGIDVKKPMSHAKALIEANKIYDAQRLKLVNKMSAASKDRKDLDKLGVNSTKLNLDQFRFIPKDTAVFDNLFAHQEEVKSQYGISNSGEMKNGGLDRDEDYGSKKKPYPSVKSGDFAGEDRSYPIPTKADAIDALRLAGLHGRSDVKAKVYAKYPELKKHQAGGKPEGFSRLSRNWDKEKRAQYVYDETDGMYYHKDDIQKVLSAREEAKGITAYQGDKNFSGNKSKYSNDEWKGFAKKIGYTGNSNKELQEFIYNNPKFKPIIDQLHTQFGEPQGGTRFDSRLGHRWDLIKEAIENYDWTDEDLPQEQKLPNVGSKPSTDIINNVDATGQKGSRFYEPLRWYDVASPTNALLSSLERLPEKYNPAEFNQLRLKLQDPTAALQANQSDYNAAIASIQGIDDSNAGAAAANIANLAARKYALNNQVIGQYENQNAAIKNQEIMYNTQVRDKQSVSDQQSREVLEDKVLTSKAIQQEQKLTAADALYKTFAENRALQRNGDLIMKFSRAFDQYGEKNEYQTKFQVNPALGITPSTQKGKIDPAGGIQGLQPGKNYYNRKTGKVLRFDGINLVEVK